LPFARKAGRGPEGKRVRKIGAGTEALYPDADAEINAKINASLMSGGMPVSTRVYTMDAYRHYPHMDIKLVGTTSSTAITCHRRALSRTPVAILSKRQPMPPMASEPRRR